MESSQFKGKVKIFHRGDLRFGARAYADNGFSLVIEDSEDPEDQIDIFFQKIHDTLKTYEKEFIILNTLYEIDEADLHIGIFWKESTACSSITLSPSMLFFAGENKISITISTYATSSE
jgi:hypothetical protein